MQSIVNISQRKKFVCAIVATQVGGGVILMLMMLQPTGAATFKCHSGDVNCLIDAIHIANANDEDDTIKLKYGTYTLREVIDTGSDGLPLGLPLITSTITIKGAFAHSTKIKRGFRAAHFRIFSLDRGNPEAVLTLKRLTIKDGKLDIGGGSAVNVEPDTTLILTESIVRNNTSSCGAIQNAFGKVIVHRSRIIQNETNKFGAGAGICSDPGEVTITKSTLRDNLARDGTGGAIYCDGCDLTVNHSSIIGNEAGREGGGILAADAMMLISNSVVYGNETKGNGGAIIQFGSNLLVRQSLFLKNKADDDGGAILNNRSDLTVIGSVIARNKAGGDGGGLFNEGGTVNLERSVFRANRPNNCTGCP